jgi:hypothetical protein
MNQRNWIFSGTLCKHDAVGNCSVCTYDSVCSGKFVHTTLYALESLYVPTCMLWKVCTYQPVCSGKFVHTTLYALESLYIWSCMLWKFVHKTLYALESFRMNLKVCRTVEDVYSFRMEQFRYISYYCHKITKSILCLVVYLKGKDIVSDKFMIQNACLQRVPQCLNSHLKFSKN